MSKPDNLTNMICPICKKDSIKLIKTEGQLDILTCVTEDCPVTKLEIIHGWIYPFKWTEVQPSEAT